MVTPRATDVDTIDRAGLHARTLAELRGVWDAYLAGLSAAHLEWRRGAAYVRESSSQSMARESPTTQLTYVLSQFARREIWVPWEAVYFDNASATSIEARPKFKEMYEAAIAGHFDVIGYYISDRLFRNAAEAHEVKRELRRRGIELDYLGKLQGDARSPLLWQSESQQDLLDEYWARKTSETVGLELQRLSENGRPIGRLPEGYRVAERAPSYQGMPGKVLAYERNEPLASIIVEGKDRYLEGASLGELAIWSATTELEGTTPKGARMNWHWWRSTLGNPKYSGHQMPSSYQGFKPGDESPKRPRRMNLVSELVPCVLPPLYPLEDWQRVVEIGRERYKGSKVRHSYRVCLLSSIAYDDRCGHRMAIHGRRDDRIIMVCGTVTAQGRHSNPVRTDLAEAEVDRLFGRIRLDDRRLHAVIEQELDRLGRRDDSRPAVRSDPEIGRIQAALAALGDDAPTEVRTPLLARLERLRAQDEARRAEHNDLVRRFRVSMKDLRHWAAIWATAETARKNELLRAAGVQVRVGRPSGVTKGPAVVRSIEVHDPIFALALATAIGGLGYPGSTGLERQNATPLVELPPEVERVARLLETVVRPAERAA